MPARSFVGESDSAAILATKMSLGVTPEMKFWECVTRVSPQMQIRLLTLWNPQETSPEVQNRGINGPTKRTCVLQKIFLKKYVSGREKLHISLKFTAFNAGLCVFNHSNEQRQHRMNHVAMHHYKQCHLMTRRQIGWAVIPYFVTGDSTYDKYNYGT